jgi:hypothetical protein
VASPPGGWQPAPIAVSRLRIRNLARALDIPEDDLLLWLLEHAPELGERHAADFLPPLVEARAREALTRPAALKPPLQPERAPPTERRCAPCMAAPASPGVRALPAEGTVVCDLCGDSVNKREALALIDAFAELGLKRLLVVGGGPSTAGELRALLGEAIQLRIVDGESHNNAMHAAAELAWADVVAIWGSTILPHKVSKLYTDRRAEYRAKLVHVSRRGVAALCKTVVEQMKGRSARTAA